MKMETNEAETIEGIGHNEVSDCFVRARQPPLPQSVKKMQQDEYARSDLININCGANRGKINECKDIPGEVAWSRLLKTLHDEKLLILEKSNIFGETIRGRSRGLREKGKEASYTMREKSQSVSRIIKEQSVNASKAVKDRSHIATKSVTTLSSSFKKSRSRSPATKSNLEEKGCLKSRLPLISFNICQPFTEQHVVGKRMGDRRSPPSSSSMWSKHSWCWFTLEVPLQYLKYL